MDLQTFKRKLQILNDDEGCEVRKEYINKFINTNDKSYQEQIKSKRKFVDGYCYLGYLWDYIKDPIVIEKNYIEALTKNINVVYVFWDIHTCERICIKDYWKFDKTAVLKLELKTLLAGEKYLPEDIYIFDESLTWTVIKTHEDIDGNCYCLKSGKI